MNKIHTLFIFSELQVDVNCEKYTMLLTEDYTMVLSLLALFPPSLLFLSLLPL
jgi:hypothetical protein